jgi:hypothetical protein
MQQAQTHTASTRCTQQFTRVSTGGSSCILAQVTAMYTTTGALATERIQQMIQASLISE